MNWIHEEDAYWKAVSPWDSQDSSCLNKTSFIPLLAVVCHNSQSKARWVQFISTGRLLRCVKLSKRLLAGSPKSFESCARDLSLLQTVWVPLSLPINGHPRPLSGGKLARAWCWPLISHLVLKLRIIGVCIYTTTSHLHRENLMFAFHFNNMLLLSCINNLLVIFSTRYVVPRDNNSHKKGEWRIENMKYKSGLQEINTKF